MITDVSERKVFEGDNKFCTRHTIFTINSIKCLEGDSEYVEMENALLLKNAYMNPLNLQVNAIYSVP